MASKDRRHFLPFAQTYFLRLREPNITSDEVHAFMNETTGLNVPLDEVNAVTFDQWRQAMKAQGFKEAWDVSEEQAVQISARAAVLKAEEIARVASKEITLSDGSKTTLEALRLEAPNVPAGELLRQHEKRMAELNGK